MELLKRIETIIEESLNAHGYSVVRVQIIGSNRKILQVMVERLDGVAIHVDDCSTVSRLVSVLLDVHNPIKDPYTLEVSSPGLDRPLVNLADYQRFCGKSVVVNTHQPIEGRKRFQGRLVSADGKGVTMDLLSAPKEGSPLVTIELESIRAAHLVYDPKVCQ